MLDISIPAKQQEHSCTSHRISVDANHDDMDGIEADTKLVNDLVAFAGKKPSRIAADLGMAATTLTRPANGKATTRIGRTTLEALRKAYPDFPGWGGEVPPPNAIPIKFEGPSLDRMRDDLPIYGTALGAARRVDGEAVEQVTLNRAEVVQYVKRPVLLNEKVEAYGLIVAGSSMEPRHMDGETIVVDPKGRVRAGEDVVVYLRPKGEDDDGERARAVLVKRLVRRTSGYIELEQYTPAITFRVEAEEVLRIDRVVPWSELL